MNSVFKNFCFNRFVILFGFVNNSIENYLNICIKPIIKQKIVFKLIFNLNIKNKTKISVNKIIG